MENLLPTCDPTIFIEEQKKGYVRYRNLEGIRWEVIGECTGIGKCWEGAVSPKPELDCPIGLNFKDDCCSFIINKLEDGDKIISTCSK